ncbi:MAG: bifunctional adenosylcobinamide kinase/adenosylcobinamide-phosphate guanylyltransferase [Paracoccaceae bacterium]|nr:MAG: bifunctional adenosylcobinamide kinase/adenosylcobinamide-phosphate guanylyltransferase [Paracoccaceae bacterium]
MTLTKFSLPPLSLVIGGARSGKSALAERLVTGTGRAPVYMATAEARDDEMRIRIAIHRARRPGWRTVEAPRNLAAPLSAVQPGAVVLLDCATMWLTNVMLAGGDLAAEEDGLMAALAACAAPVVVVTNEVGLSIVPENALARAFRDAQGRLNQRLAAASGLAVAVWAGLPLVLKGTMPGDGA